MDPFYKIDLPTNEMWLPRWHGKMVCTSPRDWTSVSFEEGRQALKDLRENSSPRSEEVLELWEHVLSRCPSQLGDELWLVYEQVCIAALDVARFELAIDSIRSLERRFPQSNRVMKLQAMQYEACEKYNLAAQIYDRFIESDPTNTTFRKRKIALFITRNQRLDAIKELNEYLKIFINDTEAWLQLSDLFLAENDFNKAVHCVEECILISPLNFLYHRRLGDLRYTMGGQDNVDLAKNYYEQAAKLNAQDLKAQYGIILCSNYISTSKAPSEKKKEAVSDGQTAASRIISRYDRIYESENPKISQIKESVLQLKSSLSK